MAGEHPERAALERLSGRWAQDCTGGMTAGLIYLEDQLGLLSALRDGDPATSEELAARTGLVQPYVREWLAAIAPATGVTRQEGVQSSALTCGVRSGRSGCADLPS